MEDKNQTNSSESSDKKGALSSFVSIFKGKEEEPPAGNAFTEVKKSGDDKKEETNKIIENIVKQTEEEGLILGPKPIQPAFPIKEKPPILYLAMKFIFQISALAFLTVVAFLYYQLTPEFTHLQDFLGDNLSQKMQTSNDEIKQTQAKINTNRYLVIKLKLDNFASLAETYLLKQSKLNSELTTDEAVKTALTEEITDLDKQLRDLLTVIKDNYKKPFSLTLAGATDSSMAETEFKTATQTYIQEEKNGLQASLNQEELKKEVTAKIINYDMVLAILDNINLKTEITGLDLGKELDPKDVEKIHLLTNKMIKNEFSIVAKIKSNNIKWSKVISDIEKITKKIDPLFEHTSLQDIGEIAYKSYAFDGKTKKVQITGNANREDNRNFTLISNLIDAFENSAEFKNVGLRTFSKSEAEKKTTSPISIGMEMEDETAVETKPTN